MIKKKTKRFLALFALLSVATICSVSALAGCASCNPDDGQTGYRPESPSIIEDVPDDGSTPDSFDALQNVAYVIGKLNSRSYYHSENQNTALATALGFINVSQNITGSKDYYNGILIASTISVNSSSLAPSKAIQKYYGEGEVIIRTAASSDRNDWNGLDTEWSTGAPSEILTEDEYVERYGLWASEFSDYVINADTVSSSSMTTDSDGNYVVTLNFVVSGENDATYFYKKQMVTMGELSATPEFEHATMTITFTPDWTVLSYTTEESYKSQKGLINASVKGTATTTFSYELEDVDVSAFDDYFVNYINSDDSHLNAQYHLDQGLENVLSGQTLSMSADIGGISLNGYLAMTGDSASDISSFTLNSNGMQLMIEDDWLYITIGGINAKADLEDSTVALVADYYTRDDSSATIEGRLSVVGIDIPVTFNFTVVDGSLSLTEISSSSAIGEATASMTITPASSPFEFIQVDKAAAVDITSFAKDIISSLTGGTFTAEIDYDEDLLSVSGSAIVDYGGSAEDIEAEVSLTIKEYEYGENGERAEASAYCIHLTFVNGMLYVTVSNSGMDADSALKLKVSSADLKEVVSQLSPVLSLLGIDFSAFNLQGDSILATIASAAKDLTVGAATDDDGNNALTISNNTGSQSALTLALTVAKNNAPTVSAPENVEGYIDLAFISDLAEDVTGTLMQSIYGYDFSGSVEVNLLGTTDLFDFHISAKIAYYEQELVAIIDLNVEAAAENIYYGDAQTQIIVKSGMVYITKTQTSEQVGTEFVDFDDDDEYLVYNRVMTLEYFVNNIYEELLFALNINQTSFESSISAALEMVSGMAGGGESSYDFGDLIGISAEGGTYSVMVDIAKLLGLEEGAVQIDIKSDDVEGTPVISNIDIGVDLKVSLFGVMSIEAVSGSIKITNHDPGKAVDVSSAATSISAVVDAFGYESEEELLAAVEKNGGCVTLLPQNTDTAAAA